MRVLCSTPDDNSTQAKPSFQSPSREGADLRQFGGALGVFALCKKDPEAGGLDWSGTTAEHVMQVFGAARKLVTAEKKQDSAAGEVPWQNGRCFYLLLLLKAGGGYALFRQDHATELKEAVNAASGLAPDAVAIRQATSVAWKMLPSVQRSKLSEEADACTVRGKRLLDTSRAGPVATPSSLSCSYQGCMRSEGAVGAKPREVYCGGVDRRTHFAEGCVTGDNDRRGHCTFSL